MEKEKTTIEQAFIQNCWDGNEEKVEACILLEVDVNCVGKASGEPAGNPSSSGLTKAAVMGHIDVVDLLLTEPGIDINQTCEGFNTLATTCWNSKDRSEIIANLCSDPRIKLNKKDTYGRTPAFNVVENGSIENMKALMNVPGVNWNIKDNEGINPLLLAVKKQNAEKVAELVKIPGIDLNTRNKSGKTLEQVARYESPFWSVAASQHTDP